MSNNFKFSFKFVAGMNLMWLFRAKRIIECIRIQNSEYRTDWKKLWAESKVQSSFVVHLSWIHRYYISLEWNLISHQRFPFSTNNQFPPTIKFAVRYCSFKCICNCLLILISYNLMTFKATNGHKCYSTIKRSITALETH